MIQNLLLAAIVCLPSPQDEIDRTLHGWYLIEKEEQKIGFAHIRINPVEDRKWSYRFDVLIEKGNDSFKKTYYLDKEFKPLGREEHLFVTILRVRQTGVFDERYVTTATEEREYLGKKTSVSKVVAADRTLWVDKWGRIVEWDTTDGERLILVKNLKTGFARLGRRDPFKRLDKPVVDPGVRIEEVDPDVRLFETCEELVQRLRQFRTEEIYFSFLSRFVRLRKSLIDGSDMVRLAALDRLKKEAETYHPGAKSVIAEANRLLIAILKNPDQEQQVESRMAAMEGLRTRPELIGSDLRVELENLIDQAGQTLALARIRAELRDKRLVMKGTVEKVSQRRVATPYAKEVTLVKIDTLALINDRVLREGDHVGGVLIEKITRFGATVLYRGVRRELRLK